jgi:SNF2 family DNA or RNA helicase
MPRLVEVCPQCGKVKQVQWQSKDTLFFKCGHSQGIEQKPLFDSQFDFSSRDGRKAAYEYQETGVKFFVESNWNGLCADAPGLGKTMQLILAWKENIAELSPLLITCPAAVQHNWIRELHEWGLDTEVFDSINPVLGRNALIPKGFKIYIVSHDSLAGNLKALINIGFKCIGVDECHKFKDISSQRTKALIKLVAGYDISKPQRYSDFRTVKKTEGQGIPHKMFLSGTPIMNRAEEYFPILNLLDPVNFPDFASFKRLWLSDGRIQSWKLERFKEKTSQYIIRREKTEVLKKLPPFGRNFEIVTIEDEQVKNTYNSELKQFRLEMLEGMKSMEILGWLTKMRRLTALAKAPHAREWVTNWMEDGLINQLVDPTYPLKLNIGVHHEDVVNELYYGLNKYGTLKLTGKDGPFEKQRIVDKFTNEDNFHILVCSMLAGGVGLNIQAAPNLLVLERQWNAANEEQFEARAWRDGQKYPVIATYLVAHGTIDQFFNEKVEMKRQICKTTLGDSYDLTSDREGMEDLAWKTINNPLK